MKRANIFGIFLLFNIFLFYPQTGSAEAMEDKFQTLASDNQESIILAGGCFWGMEDIIRNIKGVVRTRVGYTGGQYENPKYSDITTGKTGHAESVEVVYDPKVLPFKDLLAFFFRMHDPTTLNKQGNDIGTQYRSAIFYKSDQQKKVANETIEELSKAGKWKSQIVTEVTPAGPFYEAEDYHQDYLVKNPGGYTCHFLRD